MTAQLKTASHLISMVGPRQNEDPVGRVGDVLIVEPDAHTVLSRLLKNIYYQTSGDIAEPQHFLRRAVNPNYGSGSGSRSSSYTNICHIYSTGTWKIFFHFLISTKNMNLKNYLFSHFSVTITIYI
jgi:hypothetical protein